MWQRFLPLFALACLTSLSGCTVVSNLLQSITRVPRSIIRSVTDAETPEATENPAPGNPEADDPEAITIATTPLEKR